MISYLKAKSFINKISPLGTEEILPSKALKRVVAKDVISMADAPPYDSSLKDGYAIYASCIKDASENNPVELDVIASCFAGEQKRKVLPFGKAIKIMTGAVIPKGADAVLPQELTKEKGNNKVICLADTTPGRNILKKGVDVSFKEIICQKDTFLTPALLGLITGANVSKINVYKLPKVAIIATGSELSDKENGSVSGKIFPSNRATIAAWLEEFGIRSKLMLCGDDKNELLQLVHKGLLEFDVVITSGGVLDGERDLVISVMEQAGVEFLFRRAKIGPGKGVCMGVANNKLVFNLPGGPPSNYVAFIFIALPAILRLSGFKSDFPPVISATLTSTVKGRSDWTQFILSRTFFKGNAFWCEPVFEESRLKRIAFSNSVIILDEGITKITKGQIAKVAMLDLIGTEM